jgi:N-acetylglutamate synthase/N-acetylornithine aminotransferase
MLTIFDREFRREKTLDVARRMAEKESGKPKIKKEKDNKVERLESQLLQISDEFFEEVAEDEEERELIRQRGAQAQEAL